MRRKITALLFLAIYSASVVSQDNKALQNTLAQLSIFQNKAKAAYNAEMQREKEEQLDNPSRLDPGGNRVAYLKHELEITTANYQTYVEALRSAQKLDKPDEAEVYSGGIKLPSKLSILKEFDRVENMFQEFRKAQCNAAYNAYLGGSIAPEMAQACDQELLRNHMRELEHIYQFLH